ncbi:unnamed protein product [Effrenium voratum]|nr:unnamed protein product [Effrenium voratum]
MGGTFFRLSMAKNGATSFSPMHVIQGSPESSYVTMNVYGLFQMNQGDTAELKVNSYNDNSYTIQAESGFSGHLLETTEAFMAYKASHQYVTTSGTTEITPWSTTGSTMYTHHANFDGTSFVASTSGFYHVSANIRLDQAGTGYFRLMVLINGAHDTRNGLHTIKSNTVNSYFSMNLDGNIQVNSGDRISLAVLSSSDTAYTVQAESGFGVYLVDSNAAGASGQFAVVPTWRTSGSAGLMDQGDAFNETTGHFHAPSTGYYHVSGNVRLDVLGGSYSRLVVAIDDSPDANAGLHAIQGNPDPTYVTSSVAGDVYLAAGQTLSLFVYSHTDWNYNVQGESGFSVHSLGSSVIGFAADMDTAMSLSGGSDTRVQTWRTTAAGNFNSGHFHTGTGIFTAPLAGWYLFSANVRFDSVPDTSYVRLMIGVDGKPSANDGAHAISGAPHQPYYTLSLETARYIDKGQQVALYVILSNSGDSCTIQSESGFSGHLIESRTATGFDTKLGDFKAPTTGYYALDAGVRLDGAAGTYTRARIAINDQSTTLNGLHSIEGSPEASYYTHSLSGVAKLNAGDTAHLVVFSASETPTTQSTLTRSSRAF